MTKAQKKTLQAKFFAELGNNTATFMAMFDMAPNLAIYMKDLHGRIMAVNRRNCDICNFRNVWDAIGKTSRDIFPGQYADVYMTQDREILKSGRPILNRILPYPADRSSSCLIANVFPLRGRRGQIIGTACAYRLASDTELSSLRYDKVRKVSSFVEAHYADELTLNQLINLSGMSKSTFIRVFSETFNMTPWHYITTIRLNAARTLLETSDKLLADIAAETGFFDQSHLTRVFKKERGITPGEYRRHHRTPPLR